MYTFFWNVHVGKYLHQAEDCLIWSSKQAITISTTPILSPNLCQWAAHLSFVILVEGRERGKLLSHSSKRIPTLSYFITSSYHYLL